jgi:site-specific DNA-methyltransferase (adenine-specific)
MEEDREWVGADVLITDPPYGMKYQSNSSKAGPTTPIYGDQSTDLRDDCLAMWGSTKPAIVFGTWRVPRPLGTRQLVIWHKGDSPGMGDLTLPWGPSHEDIYVLGGHGAEPWVGPRGPSVIRARVKEGTAKKDHDHPTPKPVFLMQTLISHVNPAYVIADPFVGSGATLVAAKMLRRRAIGVEMDAEYIEATVRRLERIK